MPNVKKSLVCLAALLGAVLPAVAQDPLPLPKPPPPISVPPVPPRGGCKGFVFVSNGAGDLRGTSDGFRGAIAELGLCWHVETVLWSRCPGPGLWDLVDHGNHKIKGEELARAVNIYRATHPGHAIQLVGHSSGAAVV